MKFTTILFLAFFVQLYAHTDAQNSIDLEVSEKNIPRVLKIIERQSDYRFVYNNQIIPIHHKVTLHLKSKNLNELLDSVLEGTALGYSIRENGLVVIRRNRNEIPLEQTISGVVVDDEGTPVIGANIREKGTQNGTTTDFDGRFVLDISGPNSVLIITYIGYETQEVPVGNNTSLNIELEESVETLEEVVVVGYGEQERVNLTGAVTTLDMTDRQRQPLTNASNALHGVPGLFVRLGQSMPGTDRAQIRIRGVGTLNNNNPLVLVDGIEYSMDELNPDDIKSITVLKDASAAIYGSRAANGVILVTTKGGGMASQVNYNVYTGIQKPTILPDVIWDPIEYMKLKNEAVLNSGKSQPEYSAEDIAEYEAGMDNDPYTYPASNWFDIALEDGTITKHNLSFSGGSQKFKYRLALGYLDRDGIIIGSNSKEKKYSIGLNTSVQISDRLNVGLTLNGYYRHYNQPVYSNSSYWKYIMRALPLLPDQLENGAYGFPWIRTGGRNNWEHPRMLAENGNYKKYVQRFLSTIYADYQLPWNITYHAKLGVDKYDGLLERFVPQMTKQHNKTGAIQNWNNPATAPRSYNYDDNDLNLHFYHTLSWAQSFDRHSLSAMAGGSFDKFDRRGFNAQVTGYLDGSLPALSAGTERLSTAGNRTEDVLISYFGRLNYNFDKKYLIEATARYDGSSRFAPGNRWGFFPSVSLGWRLDKESFLSASPLISLLKLRASVGQLGNQAVDLYSYENSIALGQNYNFAGQLVPGAAATSYSDPSISWETTTSYDAGIDLGLMENRFNIYLDIYKKRTTGILRPVNLPSQVGNLGGPQRNVGKVDNTGFEIDTRFRNKWGGLDYEVFANYNFNANKVVDLDGQILYGHGTNLSTITQEGTEMNAHYVLDAIGLFQTEQEVEAHAFQGNDTRPGYIKYRDVNGDDIINGDDRVVVNSSSIMPKSTFGFGFRLGYKNFELNTFFQGIAGIKLYPRGNLAFPFNNGANATWEWATDAWTPENPDARLPIVTEANTGNFEHSDFWLKDGSYIRLKNIQLGYSFDQKVLSKIKVKKLDVFINAQDWFTFSKYENFDPESIINYSSLYHHPMLKTVNVGLNITL